MPVYLYIEDLYVNKLNLSQNKGLVSKSYESNYYVLGIVFPP